MTDLEKILPLWRELEAQGADYVLATVAAVEGSSYRRPGARMLLAQDGRRAGTVSGGCLEAAVAKKAWWLTANGPVLERYSTLDDDGDLPYGSGCGGIVYILLERSATARPLLQELEKAFHARVPLAIATVLEGEAIGQRSFAGLTAKAKTAGDATLRQLAAEGLHSEKTIDTHVPVQKAHMRIWVDYRPARPGLWIFGAGDDVKPLQNLAKELGWFVAIADGRTHLTTRARFAPADEIHSLKIEDLPGLAWDSLDLHAADAAILATHSFEQDAHILAALLSETRRIPLAYVGVLGPQRRTREVLAEAARLIGEGPSTEQIEEWLEQLHAPTGLDLNADTPASIALSILAEVQKVLSGATGQPLREVRATAAQPEALLKRGPDALRK